MPSKLINGDYEKDGNAVTVSYTDSLLQNAFVTLMTKRKSFYPNKSFGSKIRNMYLTPAEEYAFAYACQALEELDGVFVKSAEVTENGVTVFLIVNNTERQVTVPLDNVI